MIAARVTSCMDPSPCGSRRIRRWSPATRSDTASTLHELPVRPVGFTRPFFSVKMTWRPESLIMDHIDNDYRHKRLPARMRTHYTIGELAGATGVPTSTVRAITSASASLKLLGPHCGKLPALRGRGSGTAAVHSGGSGVRFHSRRCGNDARSTPRFRPLLAGMSRA